MKHIVIDKAAEIERLQEQLMKARATNVIHKLEEGDLFLFEGRPRFILNGRGGNLDGDFQGSVDFYNRMFDEHPDRCQYLGRIPPVLRDALPSEILGDMTRAMEDYHHERYENK